MYRDVMESQIRTNNFPRAAWASLESRDMFDLRYRSDRFRIHCLCEICQIDKEIREQELKKNAILAAIQECKKMIQENLNQ